jgi:hypothetical protein
MNNMEWAIQPVMIMVLFDLFWVSSLRREWLQSLKFEHTGEWQDIFLSAVAWAFLVIPPTFAIVWVV